MPDASFDLLVIGGGPAGYVGAIRAAQLGLKVACAERDRLGGVCNNWGCIPTKALLAQAQFYHQLTHDAQAMGITVQNISYDWSKVIARSRGVADLGAKGVAALFKKHQIEHIQGHARITAAASASGSSPCTIEIHDQPGHVARTLTAKRVLIATGARPRELPGVEFDGEKILSAKAAMSLPTQPKRMLIIGAGAIGMEFAYFYHAFGTKVTLIEMLDRLLPIEDREVSDAIGKAYRKLGITALTAHKTLSIQKTSAGVQAVVAPVKDEKKTQTLEADVVLIAIGVKGKYDGLFADAIAAQVEIVKDHIKVDCRAPGSDYHTSAPGLHAVGDVIGPPWLAHVASEEAITAVERIALQLNPKLDVHPHDVDYTSVPGCTYCHPQVASVGLTEDACKEQGLEYTVGKFPFLASGKARAVGNTDGFVKLITGKKYGEILGAHMIGDHVTELIAEMGLARRLEATAAEIIATMHAHPTLSEAVHEAALATMGRMIHY
jgi:dihydrolipoamide dehydrogenase